MNILAVGCHPDDLEIGCGGTLAKYVKQGNSVFMCHVANGNKGHAIIMPNELRDIRIKEAKSAGEILGAAEVINIDIDDLEVNSKDKVLITKMIDVIRYTKPDIIITHSQEDYMRDHVEVSHLVFDASFSCSVPHMVTNHEFYPKIPTLYYMDTLAGVGFMPLEYVNISEEIDVKLEALNCHQSQIKWMLEHDKIDFIDFVKTVSKFRGLQCGTNYAEGFRKCETWPRIPSFRLLP